MQTRRSFITRTTAGGFGLFLGCRLGGSTLVARISGATLSGLPQFMTPLLIPPVMPRASVLRQRGGKNIDYYEISVRQFAQQILPAGYPATIVWGYGAVASQSRRGLLVHNAPSLTIEADWRRPVRVKWINELRVDPSDPTSSSLPHLLPVDPTLHWANPPGGTAGRDRRPTFTSTPGPYTGPVPIVTHVHGADGVGDESDGYAEAWYLPVAGDIPPGYATTGTWYDYFAAKAAATFGASWGPGFATFEYPNLNRASTLWYHDHALGMTRLNVYAGPAGFYLLRGGPNGDDAVVDTRFETTAVLPGPAPKASDGFPSNKTYLEIPIAIQDRTFTEQGALFYPDTRALFDGIAGPYIPHGPFAPIWNPEFFGDAIIVNGNTWPFQVVERRRYRFRLLNGCQSRFLILDFSQIPGVEVWQIGNDGGFLAAPVNLTGEHRNRLLLGLAERADLIVDFTSVPRGRYVLDNLGPDEPFGGGEPGVDFAPADPGTTGRLLEFRVVPATSVDATTPPTYLRLPATPRFPTETRTRSLALIEREAIGDDDIGASADGPTEALLGTVQRGVPTEAMWADPITETPDAGTTEVWEFYNTTADAHPMHVHDVVFEVVNRQALALDASGDPVEPLTPTGPLLAPEPWETGVKDTVTAYPGHVTRIRATFRREGRFVWHCHVVEHEDNEMMRPYRIGPPQPGEPRP